MKEEVKHSTRVPEGKQLEDPCREYLASSDIAIKSTRSLGTDDGFKSGILTDLINFKFMSLKLSLAVCSKNLLKVCEKLMSNKEFATTSRADEADDFEELSLMNEKSRMEFYRKKHGNRRGSQSLPVSPKLERKALPESTVGNYNPYFTVAKPQQEKSSNISFLTNLFGITAAKPAEARANLAQKYESDRAEVLASASDTINVDSAAQRNQKLTPKSNEYREMNIFSPTSM